MISHVGNNDAPLIV